MYAHKRKLREGKNKGTFRDLRYIHLFVCIARCQKYCQPSLKTMAMLNRTAGSKTQYIACAIQISHLIKPPSISVKAPPKALDLFPIVMSGKMARDDMLKPLMPVIGPLHLLASMPTSPSMIFTAGTTQSCITRRTDCAQTAMSYVSLPVISSVPKTTCPKNKPKAVCTTCCVTTARRTSNADTRLRAFKAAGVWMRYSSKRL